VVISRLAGILHFGLFGGIGNDAHTRFYGFGGSPFRLFYLGDFYGLVGVLCDCSEVFGESVISAIQLRYGLIWIY